MRLGKSARWFWGIYVLLVPVTSGFDVLVSDYFELDFWGFAIVQFLASFVFAFWWMLHGHGCIFTPLYAPVAMIVAQTGAAVLYYLAGFPFVDTGHVYIVSLIGATTAIIWIASSVGIVLAMVTDHWARCVARWVTCWMRRTG